MSDIPGPQTTNAPVADVTIRTDDSGICQTESYEVKPLGASKSDYMITIRKSLLQRTHMKLRKAKKPPFGWDEFALLAFSGTGGAALTAVLSPPSNIGSLRFVFHTLFPVIAFASLVFAVMYKVLIRKTKDYLVNEILAELDPINEAIENEKGAKDEP